MILKDLLKDLDCDVEGSKDIKIEDVIYDSRKIKNGCMFVCLEGADFDAHNFIQSAIDNGAVAIMTNRKFSQSFNNITIIKVNNTRQALAYISSKFFNEPASQLKIIGVTGTKGKTTTTAMIKSILEAEKIKVATIGTLGIVMGERVIPTNNTTPESYEIQKVLRQMVDQGYEYVVMEASSIGFKAHRLDCIEFDYGIFTNFSSDHIGGNEHKDLNEYFEYKKIIFDKSKCGFVNIDDEKGRYIYERKDQNYGCIIKSFGFSEDADIKASNEHLISRPAYLGVGFDAKGQDENNFDISIEVNIPGKFSVYNALAALAVCKAIGISDRSIQKGLSDVKVKGRVEIVDIGKNCTLLIDYAHNAVSMENVLTTLREYNPNRLITLFGAGGNRPKVRRYEMGEASGRLSDLSVITEDNSRYEDVIDIIEDIKVGIEKTNGQYIVIPDRRQAIKYCIENSQSGDIIVLAGKGHEDYQEIKGQKFHLDERQVISDILCGKI